MQVLLVQNHPAVSQVLVEVLLKAVQVKMMLLKNRRTQLIDPDSVDI